MSPADGSNCGIVHLNINRGYINLGTGENYKCGSNRIVFGCIFRNAAGVEPNIPSQKDNQPDWLRYTNKFRAAININVYENALVAQNVIPKSGDDNFIMREYPLKDRKGVIIPFDIEFDYDNRPGIYVNHYCIGGAGGTGYRDGILYERAAWNARPHGHRHRGGPHGADRFRPVAAHCPGNRGGAGGALRTHDGAAAAR